MFRRILAVSLSPAHLSRVITHANNFNLIRLLAAALVFGFHLYRFQYIPEPYGAYVHAVFAAFPGVPIFFIVSGFLVTNSLLNSNNLRAYVKARLLRIYPALILAVLFSAMLLFAFGFWEQVEPYKAWRWVAMQSTGYFVFRMPKAFEGFTGGLVNGNLWTISVELSFYAALPFILWWHGRHEMRATYITSALMFLSWLLVTFDDFGQHSNPNLQHGLLHNFWWLGWGVLARLHWPAMQWLLTGRSVEWLLAHAVVYAAWVIIVYQGGNVPAGSMWLVTLAPMVLSLAFTRPLCGQKNDYSYGLYLLHPLTIHLANAMGVGGPSSLVAVVVLSAAFAVLSWHLIEQPLLLLKRPKSARTA